jgi:phosphoenolpyruvate carboxylase
MDTTNNFDASLKYLMVLFARLLDESGHKNLAGQLPWLGDAAEKGPIKDKVQFLQASSIAFQLLNLLEEWHQEYAFKKSASLSGNNAEPGTWADAIGNLKAKGADKEAVLEKLMQIAIEPVLTAHPTEAKRVTTLEHHRHIYGLLKLLFFSGLKDRGLERKIMVELERLWLTGEIYLEKPDVEAELNNALYYLTRIFPNAIAQVDDNLVNSLQKHYGAEDLMEIGFPSISFGDWIGGDRDGHPLVTAQVTEKTLRKLRESALRLHQKKLKDLVKGMSISDLYVSPSDALLNRIKQYVEELGEAGEKAVERNPKESIRQFINLMVLRLPAEEGAPFKYKNAEGLLDDLKFVQQELLRHKFQYLANYDVRHAIRLAESFGFHLAALDIRQNSQRHDLVFEQLLQSNQKEDWQFSTWPEQKRLDMLNDIISGKNQLEPVGETFKEATETLQYLKVLKDWVERYGEKGIGSYIVSMTRSYSDLLAVFALFKVSGLLQKGSRGIYSVIPVVPLFETIEDLEKAPAIMEEYLASEPVKATIEYLSEVNKKRLSQQVMVGYSDSNKDGGIMASFWSLQEAQKRITEVGKAHGISIYFFHGRGGTISRGAGPTNRFIGALPAATNDFHLRLTEQGETISQKYGNPGTACYNLELLTAGLLQRKMEEHHDSGHLSSLGQFLKAKSFEAYRALIDKEGFIEFFGQATPIDVIEAAKIGSRPARRTGKRSLGDLRAIPWVFSWSQSRYYLSGWFGAGSALQALEAEQPQLFEQLKVDYLQVPQVEYLLKNISTSILTADPEIMQLYAGLLENSQIRVTFFEIILKEYSLTIQQLEKVFGKSIKEARPTISRVLGRRSLALKPLHELQVEEIRKWRELKNAGKVEESDAMLKSLLLSINAIAAGLRTTG